MSETRAALAVGNQLNQSIPRPRPTKVQLIAIGIVIAEFCLLPLVFTLFALARPFSSVLLALGSDPNAAPSLWFLQDQYAFLVELGFDPSSIALSLRIFDFLIWISIPVVLLRLLSGFLLTNFLDLRKGRERFKASPVKIILGWLIMPGGALAALDIRTTSTFWFLRPLLQISPNWFIFLEAFFFIAGLIWFSEGLLLLVLLGLNRKADDPSSQSASMRKG
jgi:hypothetical protein